MSGNVLSGLSARLTHVPAAYADEAVALFTLIAEKNGGRMMGRYQLTVAEAKRYVYDEGCTLILYGTPAGFWTWAETGTSAHEIAAKKRRKAAAGRRRGHGATRGHAPTFTGRPAKRKKKAQRQPGRVYGGYGHPVRRVRHPGTSGRRAWTKTVDEATPKLTQALELALAQAAV